MPFIDEYMPSKVPGTPCISSPRTKTIIQVNAGGNERRNQEWEHPLHHFMLPEATARGWDVVQDLMKHWRIMRGPYRSWPFRDPLDFASRDLVKPNLIPTVTMTDQFIGFGDGFTVAFQLIKTYSVGSETYDRTIHLPVTASVLVANNGVLVPSSNYTVSRPGGVITFSVPPLNTRSITAGFLFDNEVRFESDDQMDAILRAHHAAGFAELTLTEVRPC